LTVADGANVLAQSSRRGAGGPLTVSVGDSVTVNSGASLGTVAFASANAGSIAITAAGAVTVDMTVVADASIPDGIGSVTKGIGRTGDVSVAESLTITNAATVASLTTAAGNRVMSLGKRHLHAVNRWLKLGPRVRDGYCRRRRAREQRQRGHGYRNCCDSVARQPRDDHEQQFRIRQCWERLGYGQRSADGRWSGGSRLAVRVAADSETGSTGDVGDVTIKAGTVSIVNGGLISSSTLAASGVASASAGNAGNITVSADALSIASNGAIIANTLGFGNAGRVSI
jgi:large exoprotein involved in heme utilization and adhesion